jgi:hypothetical protein
MLINKCFKFQIKKLLCKFNYKCASFDIEKNLDDEIRFKDTDKNHMEEWKRKAKEEQENVMRRAHEIVRKRQEEAKRSNKEFLMKMKIPGVKEEPEK